ncbi:MAG: hypothetical protein M3296_09335, partial [Actinomycetota bacterium]|nr:hypothetical protein [Actinomycetota bacterium]
MKRSAFLVLAAIAVATFGPAAPAGAESQTESFARVIANVKMNKDGTGTVKAQYACSGEGWHLWV